MDTLRRWWDRNWLQVALIGLVISTAWFARQTQGGSLFEVYQLLTRPFQSNPSKQELLTNAKVLEMEAKLQQIEKENQYKYFFYYFSQILFSNIKNSLF